MGSVLDDLVVFLFDSVCTKGRAIVFRYMYIPFIYGDWRVHIGERALLVVYLIWFGYIARLPLWGRKGRGDVSTLWIIGYIWS
jgi:hypothetical protein